MQAAKTGLIYDPRMTQHKSKRKHPEKPQRVKFIMKMLQQKFYFNHPRVQYISTINRVVTDENIRLVHPQKYIKHVTTLWPKTSHRTDITVLDTYFNQKTQKCARLAIGGVLDGIDKIMGGQWENGFACVRPPGHHSGGRHTINGFCIYNNVAIGARYLRQHHNIKKVAIVDWDVHHGDGTQHVFQKDKDIMLISIHRYDRGTFYPGTEFGDVRNQGLGQAVGTKLNLTWDYVDQSFKEYHFQSPGDNQYIYLYHRIIEPVLKQYNPDFILVSSGFDAARGDPLGGLTITPNGYYYMTKRLMEFKKPMLVVLQGGYNLQSISLSAEAVMRALVHQQVFPEPMQVIQHQIKYKCCIPSQIHKQIDHLVDQVSKNWPTLKNQQLKSYTDTVKANQKKLFGIVQKQTSSSSSSQEQSETSKASTQSGHRYNTRSKSKTTQEEQQKIQTIKQLEKQKIQWEKQMEKMKKKQQKVKQEKIVPTSQPVQAQQVQQSVSVQTQTKTSSINMQEKLAIQTNVTSAQIQKQQIKNIQQKAEKKQKREKKQKKEKKDKKQVMKKIEEQQDQSNDGSVITQFYFAAGHLQKFKDFSPQQEKLRKITYPQQISFYQNLTFQKQFTPKYFGKQGDDTIVIQNLLHQQKDPVVVDVKLSRQSCNTMLAAERLQKQRKKQQKSTAQQYGFRISGYTTPQYKQGGLLLKDEQQVKKILKQVVTLQNKQLFCNYLKKLSAGLKQSSRRYYGTSILLIKGPKRSQIRWVDFHYWNDSHNGPDTEMIKGVHNLFKFIEELNLTN